jgi:predicted aconitase with swiveling domain
MGIINAECETITAVGCIIAEIPCIDHVAIDQIKNGQRLRLDGEQGWVQIIE